MRQKLLEVKLLSQCALADNRQAFGRLVEMHSNNVRRFLLNLTRGDACLTDDLAQETFIKAYLAIRSFKGLSGFSTWLYKIAYNEYLAHLRHTKEEQLHSDYDVADTPYVEDERLAPLMAEIDAMSEPVRTIILLYYCEERPTKEISQILSIPHSTVRVYLKRGRDYLKNKMKQ